MRFSYSSARRWLTCERAWHFAYVDRLVPIRQRRAFDVGKFVHALLEYALLGHAHTGTASPLDDGACKRVYAKLVKDENIRLEDSEHLACIVSARETLTWMRLDQWETVMLPDSTPCVELAGKIPWRGHTLEYRIDWIGRSKLTGKTWVVDHKSTRASLDDTDKTQQRKFCEFDLQLALYGDVAAHLGLEDAGAMINLIRVPKKTEPDMLKSGRLSSNKNKNTMPWSLYQRAVINHGFDVEDYADMREHLESRVWNMWKPDKVSQAGRASILDNCERALERMERSGACEIDTRSSRMCEHGTRSCLTKHAIPLAARLPYGACDRCEYETLCSHALDGNDPAAMLGTLYEVKDEASPWHDRESFDDGELADHFARSTGVGRFDMTDFQP